MSDIPVFPGPPVPFESHLPPAIHPNVLPGIIGEYAAAVTESVQVPFELPLINAFGAVAASVQRKFRVVAHDGYSEPLNLYALAVLPPESVRVRSRTPVAFHWNWNNRQRCSPLIG